MKIGLLTYHHVINPGSILQTYCGYKLLQSLYPKALIEIIDYYPEVSRLYNKERNIESRKNSWKKLEKQYREFLNKNCLFSDIRITYDNTQKGMQTLNQANYDKIFVGSDTVFQMDGYLGNYIAGPKAPNLYYLPGKANFDKYGLCVSFDPPQETDNETLKKLATHLTDFKTIFYRDQHAEELLLKMGFDKKNLLYCPDPTIMVDLHHIIPPFNKSLDQNEKMIGISIANHRIREKAIEFVSQLGYTAINMMNLVNNPGLFRGSNNNSIESKISTYRLIDGLITDRFHGSILAFSIGDYPVIGIEIDTNYPKRNGKLWDLYHRLDNIKSILRSDNQNIELVDFEKAWNNAHLNIRKIKINLTKLRLLGINNIFQGLNM